MEKDTHRERQIDQTAALHMGEGQYVNSESEIVQRGERRGEPPGGAPWEREGLEQPTSGHPFSAPEKVDK